MGSKHCVLLPFGPVSCDHLGADFGAVRGRFAKNVEDGGMVMAARMTDDAMTFMRCKKE